MRRHQEEHTVNQTDLLRYLQIRSRVRPHGQDLVWNQLNLMQQMNCVCNMLAKKAVAIALLEGYHNRTTQLLPNEVMALVCVFLSSGYEGGYC